MHKPSAVKWAISTEIFRRPGSPQIDSALQRAGIEYFQSEFDPNTREYADIPYGQDECVVMYGPIKFIRTKNRGYTPGAYGFKKDTDTSFYMTQLPGDWYFNEHCVYMPVGMIGRNKELIRDLFGDHIFMRPDSGFKSFTGFDVTMDKLDYELSALKQTSRPFDHEQCLIAKARPIKCENRFVVCDRKIVTGSQYRWDDRLMTRIDLHPDCVAMAERVAAAEWQLDTCYTVDIFLCEERGARIGEFNSFASSGLYQSDVDAIVAAVSASALKEWE